MRTMRIVMVGSILSLIGCSSVYADAPVASPPKSAPAARMKKGKSVQHKKKVAVQAPEPVSTGLDTADLEEAQGNWLFKRIWWEQAEELYEKIRAQAERLYDVRSRFFTQQTEFEKDILQPFYTAIGMNQHELQKASEELSAHLEGAGARFDAGVVRDNEATVRALQDETKVLARADADMKQVLIKLNEAINRVRHYERSAWNQFKEIARMLSDERARESFYKIDESARNIMNIDRYIREKLEPYFDQLMTTTRMHVVGTAHIVETLREHGLVLVEQKEEQAPSVSDEEDDAEQAAKGGIMSYLMMPIAAAQSLFSSMWDSLLWTIKLPYRLIFGWPTVPSEEYVDEDERVID